MICNDALAGYQTPFLSIDLAAVRHNVATILAHVDGHHDRWRPHLKTSKLPSVYRELVRAGLRSFKCATTGEAALILGVLDAAGVSGDVLVAYPCMGPALERLDRLAREHANAAISILVEDVADVARTPARLGLFIDVNVGMNRTGVPIADRRRLEAIAREAGSRWRGLHAYEGHVATGSLDERRERARPIHHALTELVDELASRVGRAAALVTSGTPSFAPAVQHEGWQPMIDAGTRHQVSPGTVVLHDARTREICDELLLRPAALVHARIVSAPAPNILTCDAGSKAIAVDAGDPCAVVMEHPECVPGTPSEEHLPLHIAAATTVARGDRIALLPRHVCPTVNLAEAVVIMDGEDVVGVERVSARGHELGAASSRCAE